MDTPTVPYVSASEMRAVDQAMVSMYGISVVQMMEHAGRLLAVLAVQEFFAAGPGRVVVLAGSGGNGGGGLVCARNLANWGFEVTVVTSRPSSELRGLAALQFRIAQRMKLTSLAAQDVEELPSPDLIVDALIGYGLDGPPQEQYARLIVLANADSAPVLSLDVPSGLDATTGEPLDPCIQADVTLTLALPKTAFQTDQGQARAGRLFLGDIGVPPSLYQELGIEVAASPFAQSSIVRIH